MIFMWWIGCFSVNILGFCYITGIMSVTRGSGGAKLGEGKRILNADYDIEVDTRPDELTQEFLDEYKWEMGDVEEEWSQIVEDARKFVVDEITHIEAVARDEGLMDSEPLEEDRIYAQSENGTLKMSNVWGGAWRDIRAGTCQERAITLHTVYKELGIDTEYHEGFLYLDGRGSGYHGWTTVNGEYISDPSIAGEGVVPIEDAERYDERKIWVR